MTLYEMMEKGGVLMYPILLASLISLVAFFERLWWLQRRYVIPQGFVRALRNLVTRDDLGTAETLCAENGSAFAKVAASGIRHHRAGRPRMKEAMEETGRMETARIGRFVGITGVVATITPLLGLLGTVTGMIQVFRDVASKQNPEIGVFAGGIWEALLTTGAGLSVAIPSYLGYRYLLSRVDLLANAMEEESVSLLDAVTEVSETAGAPTAPAPARVGESAETEAEAS